MLLENYIEPFREAAERTDALAGGMSNYPLKIDPTFDIDLGLVVAEIAKAFSDFLPHTEVLPGNCFQISRELSYIFLNLGIRHTITIGDVELSDGLYLGLSVEKLVKDVTDGDKLDSVDNLPASKHAHAWITLENGVVIDATILASLRRKRSTPNNALSFENAVYYTGKSDTPVIRHMPVMTGFVYQQKVLAAFGDRDLHNFSQWYEDYALIMSRLDLMRLVPGRSSR
jgi:hypothetical protein